MFFSGPGVEAPAINIPVGSGVVVPADFAGVHLSNWPAYRPSNGPDPAPTFPYSWVRAQSQVYAQTGSDAGPLIWSKLNPSAGVFAWDTNPDIDLIFNAYRAAGKKMIYDLQSTPDWASSGTVADPWGIVGGNVKPDNLATITTFLASLLSRYSDVIRAVEVWNEPDFGAATGFFIGSAADMVSIAQTVHTIVKGVDTGIQVLAPCYELDAFLAAGGGAYVDGISIHPYNKTLTKTSLTQNLISYIYTEKGYAAKYGYSSLPVWVTERGFAPDSVSVATVIGELGGQAGAAEELKRILVVEAAMGVKVDMSYSYATGLSGDMSPGSAFEDAMEWFNTNVAGKIITSCVVNSNGIINATINGSNFVI